MASFKTPRRYYLRSRLYHASLRETALEGAFRAKQEAEPGTPLPSGFTLADRLAEGGYETVEDLDGADAAELREAGFSAREAKAVLDQIPSLLP